MNWWSGLVLLLPMLFWRDLMHATDLPRQILLSIFCLGCVLYAAFLRREPRRPCSVPSLVQVLAMFTAAFALILVITTFTAINKQEGVDCVVRFLLTAVVAALFARVVIGEYEYLNTLFKTLVVVSVVQSIVGILQFYGLAFTNLPPPNPDTPYGLMGHRILFCSELALLIPFCACALCLGNSRWKLFSGCAIWLATYAIIVGHTRSAWLAVAASVLVSNVLVLLLRRRFQRPFLSRWFAGMALFIFGIGLAIALAITIPQPKELNSMLKAKALSIVQLSERNLPIGSGSFRLAVWGQSLKALREHPVTGVGAGNWRIAIPAYGAATLSERCEKGDAVLDYAHNAFLQTAVECGWPGLLAYLALWSVVILIGLRVVFASQSIQDRLLGIGSLAVIGSFSTDSLFSFPNQFISHCLLVALAVGILIGLYQKQRHDSPRNAPARNLNLAGAVVPAAIFLLFTIYFACAKASFEYHNLRARAFATLQQPEKVLAEVNAGLTPLVTISHFGEPLEYYSAGAYLELGQFDTALREIQRAHRFNPTCFQVAWRMGDVFARMDRLDDAINAYRECLRLVPRCDSVLKSLGLTYYRKEMLRDSTNTLARSDYASDQSATYALGSACVQLGDYHRAANVLRDGLRKFPDSSDVLELLATLEYVHLKDFPRALDDFKHLLALNPNHPRREDYSRVIEYLALNQQTPQTR